MADNPTPDPYYVSPCMTSSEEIDVLARFVADWIPGEPSESEGAIATAIRLLRRAYLEDVAEKDHPWTVITCTLDNLDPLGAMFTGPNESAVRIDRSTWQKVKPVTVEIHIPHG